MVAKTQFAITGEDTRYFLNGAQFVLSGDLMTLVATDGHRLALVSEFQLLRLEQRLGEAIDLLSAAGIDPSMLLIARCEKEGLWAAEQCLKSASCGAVLLWPQRLRYIDLRRLQLAAANTTSLSFLFRPQRAAREQSPAALRIALSAASGGLSLRILKRRGMTLTETLFIPSAPPYAVDRPVFPALRATVHA